MVTFAACNQIFSRFQRKTYHDTKDIYFYSNKTSYLADYKRQTDYKGFYPVSNYKEF